MKANKLCCAKEQRYFSQPITLSLETTTEILGESHGVLVAISKNGQQVKLSQYSDKNEAVEQNCNSVSITETLGMSIVLQKCENSSEKPQFLDKKSTKNPYIVAKHCLCKFMGKEWRC